MRVATRVRAISEVQAAAHAIWAEAAGIPRAVVTWGAHPHAHRVRAVPAPSVAPAAAARARALPQVAAACRAAVVAADGGDKAEDTTMRNTILILVASFVAQAAFSAPAAPKTFKTPEAAVEALVKAAKAKDSNALLTLLGADAKSLIDSGDPVADRNARDRFLAGYKAAHSLDNSVPETVTLVIGEDQWPFPIPLVTAEGKWHFDSTAGAQEIIDRRVGANELATIQSCLALVDAQQEYYMRNAQKDSLQHFAAKFVSSDGKKDG